MKTSSSVNKSSHTTLENSFLGHSKKSNSMDYAPRYDQSGARSLENHVKVDRTKVIIKSVIT
jgi:hypothetical protein